MTNFFVSRHEGAQMWLQTHAEMIEAPLKMVPHLQPAQTQAGDTVIGTLPIQLVADLNNRGVRYWHLALDIPEHLRGKELSVDQMEACHARLIEYRVVTVP